MFRDGQTGSNTATHREAPSVAEDPEYVNKEKGDGTRRPDRPSGT